MNTLSISSATSFSGLAKQALHAVTHLVRNLAAWAQTEHLPAWAFGIWFLVVTTILAMRIIMHSIVRDNRLRYRIVKTFASHVWQLALKLMSSMALATSQVFQDTGAGIAAFVTAVFGLVLLLPIPMRWFIQIEDLYYRCSKRPISVVLVNKQPRLPTVRSSISRSTMNTGRSVNLTKTGRKHQAPTASDSD